MKHLKTYENWFKKTWDKLLEPDVREHYFQADWSDDEKQKLNKLYFEEKLEGGWKVFKYQSQIINTSITIKKYFHETIPGHAERVHSVYINDKNKEFVDKHIDDVIDYVKQFIPDEETTANKYNL